MAQKIIVIINAPMGEEIDADGIKYALENDGYEIELVEDTLQKRNHPFQPLAYAIQDDASIALDNSGLENTDKLVDVLSRSASDSECLADAIAEALNYEIDEGFDEDDLAEDEDEE